MILHVMLVCARISISITTCTRKPSNCLQLRCSSQTSIWQMSGTQEECSTGEQLAHDILNPTEASETADQDEDHNKVKRCECSCSKCCEIVLKADSQMVGSGAKKGQLWICNQCNALAGRIRRMQRSRGGALDDFSLIKDKEELAKFFSAYKTIQGEQLAEGLEATIQLIKSKGHSIFTGSKAEGRPLSWYRTQGYSDNHIKNIEATVKPTWDPKIGDYVYSLAIENHGHEDTETNERQTIFKPPDARPPPKRQRQSGGAVAIQVETKVA